MDSQRFSEPSPSNPGKTAEPINGDSIRVDRDYNGFAFNVEWGMFIPHSDRFNFEEPKR